MKKSSVIRSILAIMPALLLPSSLPGAQYLLIIREGQYEREIDIGTLKSGESLIHITGYDGVWFVYPWQGENPLDYRSDEEGLWIGERMVGVNLNHADQIPDPASIITVSASPYGIENLARFPNVVTVSVGGFIGDEELDFGVFAELGNLQGLYFDGGGELSISQVAAISSCSELRELDLGVCILPEGAMTEINKLPNLRSLSVAAVPDEELFALAGHKNLESISRMWMVVDTGWVDFLKSLPRFKELTIIQAEIAEEVFAYLAESNRVESLYLPFAGIYGDKVACIGQMTNLRILDVEDTGIEDEDVVHLANLMNLHTLGLGTVYLTDRGVKHIAGLKSLRRLNIGAENADEAVKYLAGLKNLRELSLYGSDITDEGLKRLASLKNLVRLNLASRDISDAGLKHLSSLSNLRYVDVSGTGVSEEGIARLAKSLPRCRIVKKY